MKKQDPQRSQHAKLELCGKAILLQSRFKRTCFRPIVNNNGQNRRKTAKIEEQMPKRAGLRRVTLEGHEI